MATHIAEEREQIVEPEPSGEFPAGDPRSTVDGKEERSGPDQVRRDVQQDAPFPAGFEHEVPVAVLQISQAAVHQAGRLGAGSGTEIALVHESGADPAHRGVPGDPGTGDAGADHQEVHGVRRHGVECAQARLVGKRSVR